MLCNLATLEAEEHVEIRALEKELGRIILAFRCNINAKPAELTDAELNRVKQVEDSLNLSLVAVES